MICLRLAVCAVYVALSFMWINSLSTLSPVTAIALMFWGLLLAGILSVELVLDIKSSDSVDRQWRIKFT